jgi:class 3 adenylate cyclase
VRTARSELPSASSSPTDGGNTGFARAAYLQHELRTPLNHIIGYCEMLLEQAQDSGSNTFISDLDRIHRAGKRLLEIIDKISDPTLCRELDEASTHYQIRSLIDQVIGYSEMLQERAKELGEIPFIPDLQKVHTAGRELLRLIVQNFVPIRADSQLTEDTRSIFIRHHTLADESFAKHGAILPAAVQDASLLIVDDDALNRDMLTRRLERLGYRVACAENGREALEKLSRESFDLLLLDVIMPVMNGFELLEQLKTEPLLGEIPVIVLSASDQLDHAVKCIQRGARDYLTKPFNPVLLQARIRSCLERKWRRQQEVSYIQRIQQERQRSDELLHVILPRDVAAELKSTGAVKPRRVENVGILFCDVVGFTAYSEQHCPEEIVSHLQALVQRFEQVCIEHNLEKIKTIGDAFMAAAGLLLPLENPALHCVRCGLEMAALTEQLPTRWRVRIGINVGPVIAGVVGDRKYQYDIWGDAVNTAARMQSAADTGSICVNAATWNLLAEHCYGRPLGRIPVKGKSEQELFLVDGLKLES